MTQAQTFQTKMRDLWEADAPLDARDEAHLHGARRETKVDDAGEADATRWRFPDGSTIVIYENGDGIE